MPWARLELARGYKPHWILSPTRLPIPPPGLDYFVVKLCSGIGRQVYLPLRDLRGKNNT